MPLEVVSKIIHDLLCLHLLCREINTASFVRVSAYGYATGSADMLEPFEHKGATSQEEFRPRSWHRPLYNLLV
jgi:hypothetical protein